MRLIDLMARAAGAEGTDETNVTWNAIEIAGLTADSRKVKPGFLFAALPGSNLDGREFIDDALTRGAVAILAPPGEDDISLNVPVLLDAQPRRRLAQMAARFFSGQPNTVVAVTGTSGKTSVAFFIQQIWSSFGFAAASIGTLGVKSPKGQVKLSHTTPDPVALHQALQELRGQGISHLALEASSHGLDQCRLDGVRLAAAVFTNLSRDHLDYHADAKEYFRAKARLFKDLLPNAGAAILHRHSEWYEQLLEICQARGHTIFSYGINLKANEHCTLSARILKRDAMGQSLEISYGDMQQQIWLPLPADFQAENAMAALAAVIGCGADPAKAIAALSYLQGAPGRLELAARTPSGASIYVDYAHKPDALENAISALRPFCTGRLNVLFGCGGDRDRGKRPIMGEIASRLADHVIVTDDNPRSEDAAAIRAEILAGTTDAVELSPRELAIQKACADLKAEDMLLVAGKGHEQGQEVAGAILPFDDCVEVRKAVAALSDAKPLASKPSDSKTAVAAPLISKGDGHGR